ncbi:hypothetical protein [Photorhabdus sp. RM71S]|uniref:hypothetical protein n=1 Tax=Photorhabdus sp. RM71S TaxID=3342824 RepID=UPI0036DB32BE
MAGSQTAQGKTGYNLLILLIKIRITVRCVLPRWRSLSNGIFQGSCRSAVRDKYRQEYDKAQERITTCSEADQCATVAKELRALQGKMTGALHNLSQNAQAHTPKKLLPGLMPGSLP